MKSQFSQKMSGERKAVMEAIAAVTHGEVQYKGAPSFAYAAGDWSIDRNGNLVSPIIDMDGSSLSFCAEMMDRLAQQGFTAGGSFAVAIYPDVYDPANLENIRAILAGKATLLKHSLGAEGPPIAGLVVKDVAGGILAEHGLDGGFAFSSFPPAATSAGVMAAIQLSARVYAQASSQKHVRTKDAPVENEKYAMRCFLLRIGMVGSDYAITRKELLHRLQGDSSFKNGPRPTDVSADAGLDSLEEALADAELIYSLNNSFEDEPG